MNCYEIVRPPMPEMLRDTIKTSHNVHKRFLRKFAYASTHFIFSRIQWCYLSTSSISKGCCGQL